MHPPRLLSKAQEQLATVELGQLHPTSTLPVILALPGVIRTPQASSKAVPVHSAHLGPNALTLMGPPSRPALLVLGRAQDRARVPRVARERSARSWELSPAPSADLVILVKPRSKEPIPASLVQVDFLVPLETLMTWLNVQLDPMHLETTLSASLVFQESTLMMELILALRVQLASPVPLEIPRTQLPAQAGLILLETPRPVSTVPLVSTLMMELIFVSFVKPATLVLRATSVIVFLVQLDHTLLKTVQTASLALKANSQQKKPLRRASCVVRARLPQRDRRLSMIVSHHAHLVNLACAFLQPWEEELQWQVFTSLAWCMLWD